MADRLHNNLELIRTLIQRAPDKAVRELEAALGGDMGGTALSGVRSMVDAEVLDRMARDVVLAPLKPMFGSRADGLDQLTFPRTALPALWRAMKAAHPDEAAAAAAVAGLRAEEGVFPEIYDTLCALAGAALRERATADYAALAEQLESTSPGGSDQMAGCLELTRLARPAVARLAEWLQRMTEERAATVRLAYKDAVEIAHDGGPRLFEILFSNLSEPWMVLRLITAVMVRPVDNYVSASELAIFGERLLADIDRRLEIIREFNLDGGVEAGKAAAAHIRLIGQEIDEFERSLNLGREGPWGARLNKAKGALAKTVEGLLKKTAEVLAAALPMAPVRIGGRIARHAAKLDVPPDPGAIARARSILTLIDQVRSAAVNGGYNSLRLKTIEEIEARLGSQVEELLDALHNGGAEEIPNARLYLEEVADLMGRVRDDKAAQIVRRRAAAA